MAGLLNSTQLGQFKSIFDTWLSNRQADGDSIATDSVGSTVSLSASANGLSASGVACWFSEAPSFEQVGAYVQLTATLVDATQALAVAKKALEKAPQPMTRCCLIWAPSPWVGSPSRSPSRWRPWMICPPWSALQVARLT